MKQLAFLFLLMILSIGTFAQRDSLQNEILNYDDGKSELISKGRRMLLDNFIDENLEKVKEVKDYLTREVENDDYMAFYPAEYWFILYWTKEYQQLLTSVIQFDESFANSMRYKIKPVNDLLYSKLLAKSIGFKDYLVAKLHESSLTDEEKDFLIMNLHYLISGEQNQQVTQEELNTMADEFLGQNPNSNYEAYTREYIRLKYVPSKWGFGVEFFSGYGIFDGSLAEEYKNNVPMGVAFDLCYKDFNLYLRDYIGFSRNLNEWNYGSGIWEKNSQVRVFLADITLGYTLLENSAFKIAPFAGIGTSGIGPTQYDLDKEPDLENVELDFSGTYSLGLNFDIKLGRPKIAIVSQNKPEDSYWFLRLRYAYNWMKFDKKFDGFNGNMHYVTVGIGGLGRTIKRDY